MIAIVIVCIVIIALLCNLAYEEIKYWNNLDPIIKDIIKERNNER